MKKYLVTGLAAVAISGMFTSCTHENDTAGGSSDLGVVETYEKAFISRFGTPSPDADWGFGPTATQASTRAIIEEINDPFTLYENTDQFYIRDAKDIPSKAKSYDFHCQDFKRADWGGAIDMNAVEKSDAWLTIEGENTLKFTAGEHYFYVTADATLNVTDYINHARIYVLPDVSFTLNMGDQYNPHYINDLEIYAAERSTINYNYPLLYKQDGGGVIFNRGTLNVPDNFEANQDAIVYNEGTINGKNITSKPGDRHPSYFYNYGDLILTGDMQLNSCANFFNEGVVNVAGKTTATQANIWWINKGHYTTGTLEFSAHNETFYNYCNLIVKGNTAFKDGKFHLMDNSYTETGTAVFGNSHFEVHMGNNSGINIKGNVSFGANGDGTDQGFFTTGTKAYVRVDGKATVAAHKYSFVVGGNIVCAIKDGIVDLGASDSGVQPTYEFKNGASQVTDFTKLNVTPKTPEQGCGATWKVPGDDPSEDVVRVIAEDMGDQTTNESSDFDFNDVVFDVEYVSASEAKVTILAAGGTLPLTVGWDGTGDYREHEVHNLLGYSETMIINTNSNVGNHKDDVKSKTITVSGSFVKDNLAVGANAIPVKVRKNGVWYDIVAPTGKAAGKLCVGTDYEWCNERQDIYNKWNDENGALFLQYVKDPNTLTKYWYRKSSNYKK